MSGFIGFESFATDVSAVSLTPFYEGADNEIKISLKHLSKKEITTKLKALKTLDALFLERSPLVLNEMLGHWCYLYPKLLQDNERRVREATHTTHAILCSVVKKAIAPHLKTILGVWLCAMNDPVKDVAAEASRAFDIAIPKHKQASVLAKYAVSVMNQLDSNLKATVESLSDMKVSTVEEAEERYERTIITTLSTVGVFLRGESLIAIGQPAADKALTSAWKLAKSPNFKIRRALYATIIALAKGSSSVLEASLAGHSRSLLTLLSSEKEPRNVASCLEAVIVFVRAFPKAWDHVNIKKDVLPALWSLMKEGLHGSGAGAYESMLPLLAALPLTSLCGDEKELAKFYNMYFEIFWAGMRSAKLGEGARVFVSSYVECVIYSARRCERDTATYEKKDVAYGKLLAPALADALNRVATILLTEKEVPEHAIDAATAGLLGDHVFKLLATTSVEVFGPGICSAINGLFWKHVWDISKIFLKSTREDIVTGGRYRKNIVKLIKPSLSNLASMSESSTLDPVDSAYSVARNLFFAAFNAKEATDNLVLLTISSNLCAELGSLKVFTLDDANRFFMEEICERLVRLSPHTPWTSQEPLVRLALSHIAQSLDLALWPSLLRACGASLTLDESSAALVTIIPAVTRIVKLALAEEPIAGYSKLMQCSLLDHLAVLMARLAVHEVHVGGSLVGCEELLTLFLERRLVSDECVTLLLEIAARSISESDVAALTLLAALCSAIRSTKVEAPYLVQLDVFEEFFKRFFDVAIHSKLVVASAEDAEEAGWMEVSDAAPDKPDKASGISAAPAARLPGLSRSIAIVALWDDTAISIWGLLPVGHASRFTELLVESLLVPPQASAASLWSYRVAALIAIPSEFGGGYNRLITLPILDRGVWKHARDACISRSEESPVAWSYESLLSVSFELLCVLGAPLVLFGSSDSKVTNDRCWLLAELAYGASISRHAPQLIHSKMASQSALAALDQEIVWPFLVEGPTRYGPVFQGLYHELVAVLVLLTREGAGASSYPNAHYASLEALYNVLLCLLRLVPSKSVSAMHDIPLALKYAALRRPVGMQHQSDTSVILEECRPRDSEDDYVLPLLEGDYVVRVAREILDTLVLPLYAATDASVEDGLSVCLAALCPQLVATKTSSSVVVSALDHNVVVASLGLTKLVDATVSCCCAASALDLESSQVEQVAALEALASFIPTGRVFTDVEIEVLVQAVESMVPWVCASALETRHSAAKVLRLCLSSSLIAPRLSVNSWRCAHDIAAMLLSERDESRTRFTVAMGALLVESLVHNTASDLFRAELAPAALYTDVPACRQALLSLWRNFERSSNAALIDVKMLEILAPVASLIPASILLAECENFNFLWLHIDRTSYVIMISAFKILHAVASNCSEALPLAEAAIEAEEDEEDEQARLVTAAQKLIPVQLVESLPVACYTGFSSVDLKLEGLRLLLKWELLLQYCIRDTRAVSAWMDVHVLAPRMLDLLRASIVSAKASREEELLRDIGTLFPVDGRFSSLSIYRLSSFTFFRTMQVVPALVRRWFDRLPRPESNAISAFTADKVSPVLMTEEMQLIVDANKGKKWHLEEMVVAANPMTREVSIIIAKDEHALEVVIKLPKNYPLHVVEVEVKRNLGIKEAVWRRWALQIRSLLAAQEGLLNAVLKWKENVDKEFDGIEPCPICFSILHVTTRAMPRLLCSTCNNKFHNSCLYKWFHSSHNRTCPMCRAPFHI